MAARINSDDFDTKVLASDNPVLLEFYSDSCIACKKISPVLADLEDEYSDSVTVYKINTGYDTDVADRYVVRANPTLIFFKNGADIDRLVGAQSIDELRAFVDNNL